MFLEALLGVGGGGSVIGGTTLPANADGENGDIYVQYSDWRGWSVDGFTPLSYIQGTGTQYVPTDIIPSVDTQAEIKLNFQSLGQASVFGSQWDGNGYLLMSYSSRLRWHTPGAIDSNVMGINQDYVVKVNKSSLIVDDMTYTGQTASSFANAPLTIYKSTYGSQGTGQFKLFYLKLYNANDLIHNLIPCKRNSDAVIGLYDLVTDKFYEGNGTFLTGEELVGTPIDAVFVKKNSTWIPIEDAEWTDINA